MAGFFRRFFHGAEEVVPQYDWSTGPMPDMLTYVVGDVHGRYDLFDDLMRQIRDDRRNRPANLILVGDYIDRGPDSAEMLSYVRRLCDTAMTNLSVTCLRGNHEQMMLDFLADPAAKADRWLSNGGLETLSSFGITRVQAETRSGRHQALADALCDAMPAGMVDWLLARPLQWQSGTLAVAHALMDPAAPVDQQEERVLLWARPWDYPQDRSDGIWLAHGHTVVDTPEVGAGRIALDTGAFRSGRLTAVAIENGEIRFLSAESGG